MQGFHQPANFTSALRVIKRTLFEFLKFFNPRWVFTLLQIKPEIVCGVIQNVTTLKTYLYYSIVLERQIKNSNCKI
jgi:hypothetical protein